MVTKPSEQEEARKQDALNSRCLQKTARVSCPKLTTSLLYQTGSNLLSPGLSPSSGTGYKNQLIAERKYKREELVINKMGDFRKIANWDKL